MRRLTWALLITLAALGTSRLARGDGPSPRARAQILRAEVLETRAQTLLEQGKFDEAEVLALRAVDIKRRAFKRDIRHPGMASAYLILADAQLLRLAGGATPDRWAAVEKVPALREGPVLVLYERAYDLFIKRHGAVHNAVAETAFLIAAIYDARDLLRETVRWALRGLNALGPAARIEERALLERGILTLAGHAHVRADERNRIAFFGLTDRLLEALPHAERYVQLCEATDPHAPDTARAHRCAASLGWGQAGDGQSGIAHCDAALRILAPLGAAQAFERNQVEVALCLHLLDQGRLAEAKTRTPALVKGTHPIAPPSFARLVRVLEEVAAGEPGDKTAAVERLCLGVQTDAHRIPTWPHTCHRYTLGLVGQESDGQTPSAETLRLRGLTHLVIGRPQLALKAYVAALGRTRGPAARARAHGSVAYVAARLGDLPLAETHAHASHDHWNPRGQPSEAEGFTAAMNLASVQTAAGKGSAARAVLDLAMAALRENPLLREPFGGNNRWRFDPIVRLLREHGRFEDVANVIEALPISDLLLSENSPAEAARIRGDYREAVRLEREYVSLYLRRDTAGRSGNLTVDWALRVLRRASTLLDLGSQEEGLAELLDVLRAFDRFTRRPALRRVQSSAQPVVLRALEEVAEAMLRRGLDKEGLALAERAFALHTSFAQIPDRRATPPFDRHPHALLIQPVLEHVRPSLPPFESKAPEIYARALLAGGEPEQARLVARAALEAILERVAAGNPRVADALHLLAQIELETAQVDAARGHLAQALGILEGALGASHPALADVLVTSGDAAVRAGDPVKAHAAYDHALGLAQKHFAPTHTLFAVIHSGKAMASLQTKEHAQAVASMRRALDLISARLDAAFVGATNAARVGMLASVRWVLANWLHVSAVAQIDGYDETLRLRGRVSDALREEMRIVRAAEGKSRALAVRLHQARRSLARQAHRAPRYGWSRLAWRRELAIKTALVATLTKQLTRKSRAFAKARQPRAATGARLRKRLKPHEALVDVLLSGGRYTAWILQREASPLRLDLGAAERLTPLLETFREAVMEAASLEDKALMLPARALRNALWDPIRGRIQGEVTTLYLVPDGSLAATPLEALQLADGRPLQDHLQLVRLTSPEALLPRRQTLRNRGLLLVGDIDFNLVERTETSQAVTGGAKSLLDRVPGSTRFQRLPGTAAEVAWIAARFKQRSASAPQTILTGADAAESSVRRAARAKATVHFATHAVVREQLHATLRLPADNALRLRAGLIRHASNFDPFLMSGLALSGVNTRTTEGLDDGMLTALEVLGLDLVGTELAFLSACGTATGIEQAGQGVFGLVRAFSLAGARQVVASLWDVDDIATFTLVTHFYDAYLGGKPIPAATALRQAAQELRQDPRFKAPRHWAAFGAYGSLRR